MDIQIRNSPTAAVARCWLAPGEEMKAEAGSMMAHSFGIKVESNLNGGLGGALKRSFVGGDSLFVTTFTNQANELGWVDIVSKVPGDIFDLEVTPQQSVVVTQNAWLGNSSGVQMDTKWGGVKLMANGNSGITAKFSGRGRILGEAFGAVDVIKLEMGQGLTIDTGHVVAFTESVNISTRKVAKGLLNTLKSSEGLVMDVLGPGLVVTQSRNVLSLVGVIASQLPHRG